MKKLLSTLTNEQVKRLKKSSFNEGEIIFHESSTCFEVGIISYGEVEISTILEDGNKVIYNEIRKGGVFGNNLVFSNDPRYRGNVIAKSNCEIYFINKTYLIYLMQTNLDFLITFLNIQSNFGKNLNSKIKLLSIQSAEERLLYFLNLNGNKITFKSVSSLAESLYLSREATSRLITKLIKKKIIVRNSNTIKLI